MAGQVKLCFAFVLVLHVSLVSCRHDYYHYYSQYIKGESSTASSPPSTAGVSASKKTDISVPEIFYSENVISAKDNIYSSSNSDAYERNLTKPVIQSGYGDTRDDMRTILRVQLIVGGIIGAVMMTFCCIGVCCLCFRSKGTEVRGYIISTNIPNQPTTRLTQPQIPQTVGVQQFPLETQTSQYPPPYYAETIQQQIQYPSTEHFLHQNPTQQQIPQTVAVQHFPPETQTPQQPPPYDTQPIQQQFQHPSTERLLHQNPIQPTGQQQNQQPLISQDYNNPETVPPPYPIKY